MKRWMILVLIFCIACANVQTPSSQGTPMLLVEAEETGNGLKGILVDGVTLEERQKISD